MSRFRPFSMFLNAWSRAKGYNSVTRWTLSTLVWLPIGITFTDIFYTVKTVSGRSMQVQYSLMYLQSTHANTTYLASQR